MNYCSLCIWCHISLL